MKFIVAAAVLLTATMAVHAQEYNPVRKQPRGADSQATDRIIVKWRGAEAKTATAAARSRKATAAAGVSLQKQRSMTADIDVMQMTEKLSGAALDSVIQNLQANPAVAYASPDLRRHAHAVTTDPRLVDQWYLLGDQIGATRTDLAWDSTLGDASIVVAVLDTGVRPEHPELGGSKLLPGYDFITDTAVANDGDGRDTDPTDPGDWVSAADMQTPDFSDCDQSDSSWHGTRVSGLIGALTNNGAGVAGAAYNTRILPVRVLGKCGGFDVDIIQAMRWAGGLSVDGVPDNANPAKIINLSLGGIGTCSSGYQDAVNDLNAAGVLVVASAGNEGGPVDSPANCSGVLGVAGIRQVGTKVGYSSLGAQVGISAPAGNCVNVTLGSTCLFSILVPIDTGLTTAVASDYSGNLNDNDPQTPGINIGTSFSAPLAAAAAALVKSLNTSLTPAQTMLVLKESATAFPTGSSTTTTTCRIPTSVNDLQDECVCTTRTCGAGMLDTNAAVTAAMGPLAVVTASGSVTSGSTVTLDGTTSFAPSGRSVTAYQWSVVNVSGATPTITSAASATTTLQVTGNGSFTVRLSVTDNQGGTDSDDLALVTTTSTDTPTFTDGGGGGGGALGWELLALGLLAGRKRWRKVTT